MEEKAEMVNYLVNQLFFIFVTIQPNVLVTVIIDCCIKTLLYSYHKQLKYSSQKQYKPMINNLSDYKKLHTNICALTEKIVRNWNKTEKTSVGKKKKKKFDNLFALDSNNIKNISASPAKKVLVDNCIYKTDGFCIIYICLNICFKVLFHCFCFLFY